MQWVWMMLAMVLCTATAWADCEKTQSDYDVVYCSSKIYMQADKELNEAYKKLVGKLDTAGKKLLKEGELAWIQTRNQDCSERRPNKILLNLDCATSATVSRTQFLNDRYRECVSAGCMNSKLR
jgi:uncharacterized protein YecT (DUF1311 family)